MVALSKLDRDLYDRLVNEDLLHKLYPDATGNWEVDKLPESIRVKSVQSGGYIPLAKIKTGGYIIDRQEAHDYIDRIGLIDIEVAEELYKVISSANEGKLEEL